MKIYLAIILICLASAAFTQTILDVNMRYIARGSCTGPEALAFDSAGYMYASNYDGRIIRFNSDGTHPIDFATTGGRPLGLKFDGAGNLIVADAYAGLLAIDASGNINTLSTEYGGVPFLLTDDLAITADGMIYFSDASSVYDLAHNLDDYGQSNGRLLSYDPSTGETVLLLSDLFFANGVAAGPNDEYILVNESWSRHVRIYWLQGPKAGETDVFADLSAFGSSIYPDNITYNGDKLFWVSTFDGPIFGLDTNGTVVYQINWEWSRFLENTSVIEQNDTLYLGSTVEKSIGVIPLPGLLTGIRGPNMNQALSAKLHQNFPNPFNATTIISYTLPEQFMVGLSVLDLAGRVVAVIEQTQKPAGNYERAWNGTDQQGNPLVSGVYFVHLQTGNYSKTIKMVYLK